VDPQLAASGAAQTASGAPAAASLVERLRAVHLAMVDAVLGGEGLARVAALAAEAAAAPVAVVVPRLGAAVVAPTAGDAALRALRRYVADRVRDRPARVPAGVAAEVPIAAGDELVGAVLLLDATATAAAAAAGAAGPAPEAAEFLHVAALAALTEVAVQEARVEVEENVRGSLLEDLRARPDLAAADLVRRAARLGCDLSQGAVALCAELTSDRPRHVVATIAEDVPGALAQHLDGRVYALLPAAGAGPEAALERARRAADRLRRHGAVGLSSLRADPAELAAALEEAELVLDVVRHSDGARWDGEGIGGGTYRLLFRVMASHPEEVRAFYEDTVAPLVRYDDQYRTDLVGTLAAYLAHNGNMNATAAAIYAHRHTVAYRLERVKDLTGLDPVLSEDRERLGLGLKAHRVLAPRLPR
jgi:sugar diacid utilization regulator